MMRTTLLACLAVLAAASVAPTVRAEAATSVWYTDFSAAQQQAQRLNRPLLVHFHTSWCGPCKRMERDVLNSPEVRQLLETRFVGVKVDADRNPAIKNRYDVSAYPTDLVLSPDGTKLTEMMGAKGKSAYVATVSRFGSTSPRVDARNAIASKPLESTPAGSQAEVGLEGYCPVTLFKTRTWKFGGKDYAHDYEGQRFYLAGPEQLKEFKADPTRFAPRILGCDPVLLTEKSETVMGSTRFAAYFDGALYLFRDHASRQQFKTDPNRFTRIQQVNIADLKTKG